MYTEKSMKIAGILFLGALGACTGGEDNAQVPTPEIPETRADSAADFVFTNGRVYTVDEDLPWAEAVAVLGNEIVYVGDSAGAMAYSGDNTESVDLGGRMMLPGLVESHIHIAIGGATTSGVILGMSDSIEEVLSKVRDYADANPDKETIFGASYSAFLFDGNGPDKQLLDDIVPDRPVFLMDHTLHAVWVNSKALEMAGIEDETPDPAGGEYMRDDNGIATGAIKGGPAHIPVLDAVEAITADSIIDTLPEVIEGLNEFGFTSAIDMGSPIATVAAYEAMHTLSKDGRLPLRLSVAYYVNTPALAADAVSKLDEYAKKYRTDTLWFDTLKISGDSVIENQKAAMIEPYLTTGHQGALYFNREEIANMAVDAAELGYNTTVHTIGDLATRSALKASGDLRTLGHDTLFSTTHSQMVHPDDRQRYVENDVTAQTTGNWAVLNPSYIELLGEERVHTRQFPLRWWADNGINIALGADWPATPGGFEHGVNPFNNIYVSMSRRAPAHLVEELGSAEGAVLGPENEVLTLYEAVEAYTMGGARMLGIEDQVGSIKVGKKADLILLDKNLFEVDIEDIPHTRVLATMFDGRVVHDVTFGLGDADMADLDTYEDISSVPARMNAGD